MYVEELHLNVQKKQQLSIGNPLFPCMCYDQYMDQLLVGRVPWHWQEELEFFLIREGKALAESEECKAKLQEGEGVFIQSNTFHQITPLGEGRCRYYSILFRPELVYGEYQGIIAQKYVGPVLECPGLAFVILHKNIPWMEAVLHCVEEACKAFLTAGYGYELLVRENFGRAWYHLAVNTREIVEKSLPSDGKEQRLREMVSYIYEHFDEGVDVASIARAAGISESECFRCFKNKLGLSPIDFLIKYRIRTAAALLMDTGKSVTEISSSVGFNNPSYFTKCFRETLGCTPREYRKREKTGRIRNHELTDS